MHFRARPLSRTILKRRNVHGWHHPLLECSGHDQRVSRRLWASVSNNKLQCRVRHGWRTQENYQLSWFLFGKAESVRIGFYTTILPWIKKILSQINSSLSLITMSSPPQKKKNTQKNPNKQTNKQQNKNKNKTKKSNQIKAKRFVYKCSAVCS